MNKLCEYAVSADINIQAWSSVWWTSKVCAAPAISRQLRRSCRGSNASKASITRCARWLNCTNTAHAEKWWLHWIRGALLIGQFNNVSQFIPSLDSSGFSRKADTAQKQKCPVMPQDTSSW